MCYSQTSSSDTPPDYRHPSAHYQIPARCSSERVDTITPETTTTFTPYNTKAPHLIRADSAEISHTHLLLRAVQREAIVPGIENVKMKKHCIHGYGARHPIPWTAIEGSDRRRNAIRTSDTCQCPCVVAQVVVVVEREREGGQSAER